jgi:hypothetical protein
MVQWYEWTNIGTENQQVTQVVHESLKKVKG